MTLNLQLDAMPNKARNLIWVGLRLCDVQVNSKADSISAWGASQSRTDVSAAARKVAKPSSTGQSSGNGSGPFKQGQPVVAMGPGVAAGDAMSLATAAAEVAASREAINVLQMSLDEADL